jgi:hypothetical protein
MGLLCAATTVKYLVVTHVDDLGYPTVNEGLVKLRTLLAFGASRNLLKSAVELRQSWHQIRVAGHGGLNLNKNDTSHWWLFGPYMAYVPSTRANSRMPHGASTGQASGQLMIIATSRLATYAPQSRELAFLRGCMPRA